MKDAGLAEGADGIDRFYAAFLPGPAVYALALDFPHFVRINRT